MVYLKRAGYDPTALVSVLERIQEPASATKDIFDDNYMKKDDARERFLNARTVLREEGYRSRIDRQYSERYNRYTSGVR